MWFWIEEMFANQANFVHWRSVHIFNNFTWLIGGGGEVSGRMNPVAMVTERRSAFISIQRTNAEISILFAFSIMESVSSGFGCIDCRLLVKLIDFPQQKWSSFLKSVRVSIGGGALCDSAYWMKYVQSIICRNNAEFSSNLPHWA